MLLCCHNCELTHHVFHVINGAFMISLFFIRIIRTFRNVTK